MTIPPAVYRAIEMGSCVTLPARDGFVAITEPTPCPRCQTMRCFFIVRQVLTESESTWLCVCYTCVGEHQADSPVGLFATKEGRDGEAV